MQIIKKKKLIGWKPKYSGYNGFYKAINYTFSWYKKIVNTLNLIFIISKIEENYLIKSFKKFLKVCKFK